MKRSELRALVLEDEEVVRTLTERVLKINGIKNVDVVDNSKEAEALLFLNKSLFEQKNYDLFILDTFQLNYPGGPDFLKKARKLGYKTKVIAMSSDPTAEKLWVNESKADYFLEKPYDINAFKKIILKEFPEP